MQLSDFTDNNPLFDLYKGVQDICWSTKNKYASDKVFFAVLFQDPEVQRFFAERGIEKIGVIAKGMHREVMQDSKRSSGYAVGNEKDPLGDRFTREAVNLFESTGHDVSKFSKAKTAAENARKINKNEKSFIQTIRYSDNAEKAIEKAITVAEFEGEIQPTSVHLLREFFRSYMSSMGIESDLKRFGISRDFVLIDDDAYLNEQKSYKPEFRSDAVNEALEKRDGIKSESDSKKTTAAQGDLKAAVIDVLKDPEVKAELSNLFRSVIQELATEMQNVQSAPAQKASRPQATPGKP